MLSPCFALSIYEFGAEVGQLMRNIETFGRNRELSIVLAGPALSNSWRAWRCISILCNSRFRWLPAQFS